VDIEVDRDRGEDDGDADEDDTDDPAMPEDEAVRTAQRLRHGGRGPTLGPRPVPQR